MTPRHFRVKCTSTGFFIRSNTFALGVVMYELPDPKYARGRALLIRSFTVVGRGALNVLGVTTIFWPRRSLLPFLGCTYLQFINSLPTSTIVIVGTNG